MADGKTGGLEGQGRDSDGNETKTERDRQTEQGRGGGAVAGAGLRGGPAGRHSGPPSEGSRVAGTSSPRCSCSSVPTWRCLRAGLRPQRSSQQVSHPGPRGGAQDLSEKKPISQLCGFSAGTPSAALEEPHPVNTEAFLHRQAQPLHGPLRGAWEQGWACRWGRPRKGKVTVTFPGALPVLLERRLRVCVSVAACQF